MYRCDLFYIMVEGKAFMEKCKKYKYGPSDILSINFKLGQAFWIQASFSEMWLLYDKRIDDKNV